MIATGTATRIERISESVQTGVSKNVSNQRSDTTSGGQVRKKSLVSDTGKMIRIGISRNNPSRTAAAQSAGAVQPSASRSEARSAESLITLPRGPGSG